MKSAELLKPAPEDNSSRADCFPRAYSSSLMRRIAEVGTVTTLDSGRAAAGDGTAASSPVSIGGAPPPAPSGGPPSVEVTAEAVTFGSILSGIASSSITVSDSFTACRLRGEVPKVSLAIPSDRLLVRVVQLRGAVSGLPFHFHLQKGPRPCVARPAPRGIRSRTWRSARSKVPRCSGTPHGSPCWGTSPW